MDLMRMTTLIERATDTLVELASLVRDAARWDSRDQDEQGDGSPAAVKALSSVNSLRKTADDQGPDSRAHSMTDEEILGRLEAFWDGVSMAPVMTFVDVRIDLGTAQGRWELLVLAVLLGARVTRRSVADTFGALRDEGLLELSAIADPSEAALRRAESILESTYRALGHKSGKLAAIVHNAGTVRDQWNGDVHDLYVGLLGPDGIDEDALLRSLKSLKHIKRLAYWVCRTMKAHGLWRELGTEAVRYHDSQSRLPLERLALPTRPAEGHVPVNVLPYYLQGVHLCAENDPATCHAECPVAKWCSFPNENWHR